MLIIQRTRFLLHICVIAFSVSLHWWLAGGDLYDRKWFKVDTVIWAPIPPFWWTLISPLYLSHTLM